MQRVSPVVFCLSGKRKKRFLFRSVFKLISSLALLLRLMGKIIDFFEKLNDMLN